MRPLLSKDRSVALTVLTVPENYDKLADWGKDVRDVPSGPGGGQRAIGEQPVPDERFARTTSSAQ
jgi:hypothetical protein